MHILCLGVMKNTNCVSFYFVSSRRNISIFERYTPILLVKLSDMELEWNKILPYFVGWVSENWLVFGRVLMWVYLPLGGISPEFVFERPYIYIYISKWLVS